MNLDFDVLCPYCEHYNQLNLQDYAVYIEEGANLIGKCDTCGEEFGFDLEIDLTTESSPM